MAFDVKATKEYLRGIAPDASKEQINQVTALAGFGWLPTAVSETGVFIVKKDNETIYVDRDGDVF